MNKTDEKRASRRCLALYSGGLDSILAIKLMEEQGIDVVALHFTTPFYGYSAYRDPVAFSKRHEELYGISVHVIDHVDNFLPVLTKPAHGYGRHMNPCIDCKISMLVAAKSLLEKFQASFIVTGEVLGQRPMSQRRDAMNIIEKSADVKEILVRPLSAQLFKPSLPEREGVLDRERLLSVSGRGRKTQEELARHFGITEIPASAGGCLLTYEKSANRVRKTFQRVLPELPCRYDLELDIMGRHFQLDPQTVFVVGRDQNENELMEKLIHPGNVFMWMKDDIGPLCILRGNVNDANLERGAAICLRYSKARGQSDHYAAWGTDPICQENYVPAPVIGEDVIREMMID